MTIKLTDARANVHLDLTMSTEADIEALIAAVRDETLQEVRGVVEGMYLGIDTEIARGRVLDKLDTLSSRTGGTE